jgi:hypothetical protein
MLTKKIFTNSLKLTCNWFNLVLMLYIKVINLLDIIEGLTYYLVTRNSRLVLSQIWKPSFLLT